MYQSLRNYPYPRLSQDIIPEQSTRVYEYFTDDLLNLAQRICILHSRSESSEIHLGDLQLYMTKILFTQVRRIGAKLFSFHITIVTVIDIKANNILSTWIMTPRRWLLTRSSSAILKTRPMFLPGSHIIGIQIGNYMWRNPEVHAEPGLGKPSQGRVRQRHRVIICRYRAADVLFCRGRYTSSVSCAPWRQPLAYSVQSSPRWI